MFLYQGQYCTRAKTDTARVNEALVKVLCHNICVVINAMHTLGVTPVYDGPMKAFASNGETSDGALAA